MGPYGQPVNSRQEDATDAELMAYISAHHPGWEIHRVFGGYEAVPTGTVVIRSAYLSAIAEKLDELSGKNGLCQRPRETPVVLSETN
jgi:hypothetical protein